MGSTLEEVVLGINSLSHRGQSALAFFRNGSCLLMLTGMLILGLGDMTCGIEGLGSLGSMFLAFGDGESLLPEREISAKWVGSRAWPLLSDSCHGLYALLQRKSLSRILETGHHWFTLPIKEPITKEGGRLLGHLLLIHDAGIHRLEDTVPALDGGSRHEINEASGSGGTEVLNIPHH